MSFEFFIGSRYLRTKQRQAFISLITLLSIAGITVGVMALIVVIAVMTGAQNQFKSQILGAQAHIMVMRHTGPFSDYDNVVKNIEKIDGVESATPFIYTQAMLRSSSAVAGAFIKGVDPETAGKVIKMLEKTPLDERFKGNIAPDSTATVPGIILGAELAASLGVMKGDVIYLISPRGMMSPIGHMPAMKRFMVTEPFKSGMYEYDTTMAYIHLEDAQKIMHMIDDVTGIEARVTDVYDVNNIGKRITSELGFPYWSKNWIQMNQNMFSALELEKKVMFIILTLIVLVAAFNIASTLIMMVMSKTKDIAILKAMGATDKSIRKIFVYNGIVIGSIGTFLGTCLGSILCAVLKRYKFIELPGDVYYFTTLPVSLEALDLFLIVSAAMVICFLATLYPAYQASKLNPIEAIRYG
jgi:lipoprotein-releasing system permease protein